MVEHPPYDLAGIQKLIADLEVWLRSLPSQPSRMERIQAKWSRGMIRHYTKLLGAYSNDGSTGDTTGGADAGAGGGRSPRSGAT